MSNLITDRTQEDVNSIDIDSNVVNKGAYNYADLNRVEAKVEELNNILFYYGYMTNTLVIKLDWTYTDYFTPSDMTRYLNNIKAIRSALAVKPTTPKVPTTMDKMTYTTANNIEKILVDIEDLIAGLRNWFVYSGVGRSGQNRVWQHRFRQFFDVIELELLTTENNDVLLTEDNKELGVFV